MNSIDTLILYTYAIIMHSSKDGVYNIILINYIYGNNTQRSGRSVSG